MAMQVKHQVEMPAPPKGVTKLKQEIKGKPLEFHEKDNVAYLSDPREWISKIEDNTDRALATALHTINSVLNLSALKESVVYEEVFEPDPTSPTIAVGASPVESDDTAEYEAWLELNTPLGYTNKIFTRPKAKWTDEDYVNVQGVKCLAPRRLRKIWAKATVLTAKGPRVKRECKYVSDTIQSREFIPIPLVKYCKSGNANSLKKRVWNDFLTPLRYRDNCVRCTGGLVGSVTHTGLNPKQKTLDMLRGRCERNSAASVAKRKLLGKTLPPPVLQSARSRRSVLWFCQHPSGVDASGVLEPGGIVSQVTAAYNHLQSVDAQQFMDYLAEECSVDTEMLVQESIVSHRNTVLESGLQIATPELELQDRQDLDQLVREYLSGLEDARCAPSVERVETPREVYPIQELIDAQPVAANETEADDLPWGDVSDAVIIEEETLKPAEPAVSGCALPPPDSVYQYGTPIPGLYRDVLVHLPSRNSRVETNGLHNRDPSKVVSESVAFVREDGVAIRTRVPPKGHPESDKVRDQVAMGLSHVTKKAEDTLRLVGSQLKLAFQGRNLKADLRTYEGSVVLSDVIGDLTRKLDILLDLELISESLRGKPQARKVLPAPSVADLGIRKMQWGDLKLPPTPEERRPVGLNRYFEAEKKAIRRAHYRHMIRDESIRERIREHNSRAENRLLEAPRERASERKRLKRISSEYRTKIRRFKKLNAGSEQRDYEVMRHPRIMKAKHRLSNEYFDASSWVSTKVLRAKEILSGESVPTSGVSKTPIVSQNTDNEIIEIPYKAVKEPANLEDAKRIAQRMDQLIEKGVPSEELELHAYKVFKSRVWTRFSEHKHWREERAAR